SCRKACASCLASANRRSACASACASLLRPIRARKNLSTTTPSTSATTATPIHAATVTSFILDVYVCKSSSGELRVLRWISAPLCCREETIRRLSYTLVKVLYKKTPRLATAFYRSPNQGVDLACIDPRLWV